MREVVFAIACLASFQLGVGVHRLSEYLPYTNWRTPKFTGNSGRSPIYPRVPMPWYYDHEATRDFRRQDRTLRNELHTTYRLKQF